MSNKDFYDEDEIIDSLIDNKTPRVTEQRQQRSTQNQQFNRPNVHIGQVGCGCFDSRKFLTNFLIYSVVLMVTSAFFSGFYLESIPAALWASFTLTILNTFVKPILFFFTLPLTIMSLGLFYFVINAVIITMTSSIMGQSFVISNFFTAFFAAIFISILQHFIKKYLLRVDQL